MANPVTRWQLLSKNPDKAAAFYTSVFGWTVDDRNALGYRQLHSGDKRGIDGGIWPAPPEAPNFIQLFIEVEDIDAVLHRVAGAGGRTLITPQLLPDGERMAVAQDAEGVSFGLFQAKR